MFINIVYNYAYKNLNSKKVSLKKWVILTAGAACTDEV